MDHAGGWPSQYLHLSRVHVSPGDEVRQGVVIGEIGSTDRSTAHTCTSRLAVTVPRSTPRTSSARRAGRNAFGGADGFAEIALTSATVATAGDGRGR